MAICLNRNSLDFQAAHKLSGISEEDFNAFASDFVDKYNRYPKNDEIPHANSEPLLREKLELGEKKNLTDTNKILDSTNSETLEEATLKIYSDQGVELFTNKKE